MRLTFLAALALLLSGSPLDGAMAQRSRAERLSASAASERIEKAQSLIRAQRHRVDQRYGYERVQKTMGESAGTSGNAMGRALKPLGARVYALWVNLDRRVDGELGRLDANRKMFIEQRYARTRDVAWLERVGERITEELMEAERCLDELTESVLSEARHRLAAQELRAKMKRLRASLARLPGGGADDPLANLKQQIEFTELSAASARATSLELEDAITTLAARAWVPILVPDAQRRETRLMDIELPEPLLQRRPPKAWVSGAATGSRLANIVAASAYRASIERLTPEAAVETVERVGDTRDALDRSRVRSLQIEGLSAVREARRLQEGLERLPELRSVFVYGNSELLFEAHRTDTAEVDRLCEQIVAQAASLNELLNAVVLLRRQLIFHAMVAERGRELRATGVPVDIRATVARVFKSSRAAHVLERAERRGLEAFYNLNTGPLQHPQHLRVAMESFLKGDMMISEGKKLPSPATAAATLAVARLLAKLSDDRAHVPLRAAKRAMRRWRFPVPGYPEKPSDALQVLTDDLTAWVHLPAAIWSETALERRMSELQDKVRSLRSLTRAHRPSDGLKLGEPITLRDGMHIEVVVALTAEHGGALEVTLAGVELVGEGFYREDTPGLLFTSHRLSLPETVDPNRSLLRVRLP